MEVNDTQENGPDQEPTAERPTTEGPQAPAGDQPTAEQPSAGGPAPKRLTRSRADRVIGGVCGGLGRYFNVDPSAVPHRRHRAGLPGRRGDPALPRGAAARAERGSSPAPIAPGGQGRNRALVIAGVVVLLVVAWPFLLFGGGLSLRGLGSRSPFWSVPACSCGGSSREKDPAASAGDIARRAALGVGVLIGCFVLFFVAGVRRGGRPRLAGPGAGRSPPAARSPPAPS